MNSFYNSDALSDQFVSSIPEIALVLELGCALQTLKVDASTLEIALSKIMQHLYLEGTVFVTPTGFLAAIRKDGYHSKTYLMRPAAGDPNLRKLSEAEALVDSILNNELDIHDARARLCKIMTRRSRFSSWAKVAASGLVAMSTADIFGGNWDDMLLSFGVGFLIGLVVSWANKQPNVSRLAPLFGGLLGSLAGKIISSIEPSTSYSIIVLSSIICLIPGLELLVSMQELGTGNLVSGTARMAGAGLTFILLVFGVGLGQQLDIFGSNALPVMSSTALFKEMAPILLSWTALPSLALAVFAYIIIFQGRLADYGWTLAVSVLTYYATYSFTNVLGPEIGTGIAALILGAGCNYYAQHNRQPEAVLLLPALMLILPGSLGVRGLTMIMNNQTLSGLRLEFQFFSVTLALMLGLLMANAIVPRRTFK